MEPFSCLAVATAAVQFLEFSSSIVSATWTIYNANPGDLNQDLHSITQKLIDLNSNIEGALKPGNPGPLSSQDEHIIQLGRQCNEVGSRLISALDRIQSQKKNQFWKSVRLALGTLWSQNEIDSLEKTLNSFRQQISMHVLVALRYLLKVLLYKTIFLIECREQFITLHRHQEQTDAQTHASLEETRSLCQNLL